MWTYIQTMVIKHNELTLPYLSRSKQNNITRSQNDLKMSITHEKRCGY